MVRVFYASQSGRSEEVADDLVREIHCRGMSVVPAEPLDCADLMLSGNVVFVVSTTGQGDPPSNMKKFWNQLLQKSLPSNLLSNLQFSIFGMGDSGYREFNYTARKLQKRLLQLGGTEFNRMGLGDDQHDFGFAQELDPWMEDLFTKLSDIEEVGPAREMVIEKYSVSDVPAREVNFHIPPGPEAESVGAATVMNITRMTTSDHFQDVRRVRLSTSIPYDAGDVAVLWPRVAPELVEKFLTELSLDGDRWISCKPLTEAVTVRELFSCYLDLTAVPTRVFFQVLSRYASNPIHAAKLAEFGGRGVDDKNALFEYCSAEKRNVVEVMWDFDSAKPPLEILVSIIPVMRPRKYSIASCRQQYVPMSSSNILKRFWDVELCIGLVEYKTYLQRDIIGTCSRYITTLRPGDVIPFAIEKGSLSLNGPMILVCPGTGVAPCRSLVLQRHLDGGALGGMKDMIFLGFRHPDKDYLFGKDWPEFSDWLDVRPTFSRHKDYNEAPYVQQQIELAGAEICDLLDQQARIYVCGRAHPMPSQVFDELVKCLEKHRGMSKESAKARLREMQRQGIYINDTWG